MSADFITLPTRFAQDKLSLEDYRRRLAENARDQRALDLHNNRPSTVVRLLKPLNISGIPRPAGYVVDILSADVERLVEQGKVEICQS